MRRTRLHAFYEGDKGAPDYQSLEDELEGLRQGTREQFESSWTWLAKAVDESDSATFTHNLGEIPWTVDVIVSENASGRLPVAADTANYTIAKTDTTITLTNDSTTTGYYYKVRAL